MKKVINYVWLGGEKPEEVIRCINSWSKYLPNFEVFEWNESNIPRNKYVENALSIENYANVSNYVRAIALEKHGGIYFDTDIEIISNNILGILEENKEKTILGIESYDPFIVNNAVIIANSGSEYIKDLKEELGKFDGFENANESSPILTSKLISRKRYNDLILLEREVFYSYQWDKYNSSTDQNAVLLHYGNATWIEQLKISNDIDTRLPSDKKYLILRKRIYDFENGHIIPFKIIFKSLTLKAKMKWKEIFSLKTKA